MTKQIRIENADTSAWPVRVTVQWVSDGVARVKARLAIDPEMAKALLPNMTHAEVKAALQKRPA